MISIYKIYEMQEVGSKFKPWGAGIPISLGGPGYPKFTQPSPAPNIEQAKLNAQKTPEESSRQEQLLNQRSKKNPTLMVKEQAKLQGQI